MPCLKMANPELLTSVLGDIASLRGDAGDRQGRGARRIEPSGVLPPAGNPEFAAVASALKVLGPRLSVATGLGEPEPLALR
jgi:DNA-binding phage protein